METKIIENCTIIYGPVPITELVTFTKKSDPGCVIDSELASLLGAVMVYGLPEDLEKLRAIRDTLQISEKRQEDSKRAKDIGCPDSVIHWLAYGRRGASSDALCGAIYPELEFSVSEYPYDPDDLQRCIEFLSLPGVEFAGTAKSRLSNSGYWRVILENLDDLKQLMSNGLRSDTYTRMKELFAEL